MKDGDKIKWIYLKRNNLGLETVGFTGWNDPQEIETLINDYAAQDYLQEMEIKNWMNNGKEGVPSSFKKIEKTKVKKFINLD